MVDNGCYGSDNISTPFGKGVKVETLKVYQPLLVTYHWEGLLTRQVMPLGKGFYDIPGRNQVV